MEKKIILLFIIIAILIGFGLITFLKRQEKNNDLIPSVSVKNRMILNKNKYPFYMVEGTVDKVYNTKPIKLDVKVKINKILSDQNQKDVVKTFIVKSDTEFILHFLKTKKEDRMDPIVFKNGDNVVIWMDEPNTDILKLDQFTATKIIKYQR